MSEARWLARLGVPVVAASLAFAASGAPPGFGLVSLAAPARAIARCAPADAAATAAAARLRAPADRPAWFTLEERLDARGTLTGWLFRTGPVAGRPAAEMDVPAESFADGPDDGVVLLGRDDGTSSTVDIVDALRGCSRGTVTSRAVVRSAARDGVTGDLFLHRVDRLTRADLGVVRVARTALTSDAGVDADAAAEAILPPWRQDAGSGPTWATRIAVSADGRTLAVQRCGAAACRLWVVDPAAATASGPVGPAHGELIGVGDGAVLAWGACTQRPCPVLRIDPATGAATTLSEAASAAEIVPAADGRRALVVEEPAGGRWRLATIDPASGDRRDSAEPDALRLRPHRGLRVEGADLPGGWVRLVPADASGPAWGPSHAPGLLLRPGDGRAIDPAADPAEVR